MTDTSQAELPPQTNGVPDGLDEEERAKMRPVDIDADVREMERRKRVEIIMNSKVFREELERIIETQLKDGSGPTGLLQQISDMVGVNKQAGNVFKSSSCVIPINDIRGIEAMGYSKGEKILRCKLACLYRLIDLYGWAHGSTTLITARLNQDDEQFLVNPYGMLFHEITASSLIKVDMQGGVVEQGTTNFSVNITAFSLHAAVHSARPDIKCIIHVHTPSVIAVSALKQGILPLSQESVVIGEISTHTYLGGLLDPEEKDKLARNLGPNNKVLLLSNQGALCCGQTIEEAFYNARNTVLASECQLKLLPVGIDNLVLLNDEIRKKIYDAAHKPPESTPRPDQPSILEGKVERKWRVGGVEFESLMRMLDNAGFRTGYIYRHPLVKGEPPRPKNDVEVPPAVSSLGYLLEEEELYRQGLWRKLEGGRKGHDRSRWLNSPNTYQKVEILETGTPDPKKITKWVADGSPSHSSTPVKIDSALQFVPKNTNPKEFKQKQQQIKDYRRADKISAGPQSHILEGVTWEEARKMQDATVTQTGDQVVLMGAASKGIIQRGHQHNAMVYKSPYAKNPFDSVTDEELDEYKKVVEKKVRGEYDTDFSESEGLSSSQQMNKRMDDMHIRSPTSVTSETEEESRDEPQILRIETKTAPRPSQPEVVLSDAEGSPVENFLRAERVSGNNYGSYKVMLPAHFNRREVVSNYYRTLSHAGFPKGSYAIPNPTHFHIARQTQIAKMRPLLVSIPTGASSSNQNYKNFCNKPTVTLNLSEAHSVALNVPIEVLKAFIFPFARALNFCSVPQLNNQSSQTTYMNNFERKPPSSVDLRKVDYTPLYIDSCQTCHFQPETVNPSQSFERQVLDDMQQHLLDDFNESFSDTSSGYTNVTNNSNASAEEIKNFTEVDELKSNESLIEITPDITAMLPTSFTSSESETSKEVECNQENSADETKDIIKVAEDFVDKLMDMYMNSESYLLLECAKNVIHQEPVEELPCVIDTSSLDEGIEDCTLTNESTVIHTSVVDDRVKELGNIVFDYLVQQCFEVKELVLFPEILHDVNMNKLLVRLKGVYEDLYGSSLNDEEKNELRIAVASYVLRLLEIDDRLKDTSDESSNLNITDKIFTISEFLSDVLDHFFNSIDNGMMGRFLDFEQQMTDNNGSVFHSTPESLKNKKMKTVDDEDCNDVSTEITSFKKQTKTGSETYWITLYNSPTREEQPQYKPQKNVVNVDDIPLKPPECIVEVDYSKRILSPILEEPRLNLFHSSSCNSRDEVDVSADPFHQTYEILNESDDSDVEKFSSTESHTYFAFDRPETNVVVNNEVNFYRTKTVSSSYIQVRQTEFKQKGGNSDNKENENPLDDFEGNWMGYEGAKF
ncbi:hypothetical protein NQ315_008398 [Exocentrus adspersus]|uniref:Class II aldolase/adducin N-terminal domain-containing protein n=1 Tax=Exocentrus adspersus TaxID=1586481 RepID=A0AAV8W533_9CUCU|nr:hypothetical protein NQ315_008398 [Exocentrus adspersus]